MKVLSIFLGVVFFCSLFPSVLATPSFTLKNSYAQGESFFAELNGSVFQTPTIEQVILKRNNVEVPFQRDIVVIEGKVYLTGVAPLSANNYTLIIKDLLTNRGNEETIEQSFIVRGEQATFAVFPQVISGFSEKTIKLISYTNTPLQISTTLPGYGLVTSDLPETALKIDFTDYPFGRSQWLIGEYVFIVHSTNPDSNEPGRTYSRYIRVVPIELDQDIRHDASGEFVLKVTNSANESLKDVQLEFDSSLLKVTPNTIPLIKPGETIELVIKILTQKVETNLIIRSANESLTFPIRVTRLNEDEIDVAPIINDSSEASEKYYCTELNGKICAPNQECSLNVILAKDTASCCTGTCQIKEESGAYQWVGYVLGTIVLVALLFVALKYYRSGKLKINPLKKQLSSIEKTT